MVMMTCRFLQLKETDNFEFITQLSSWALRERGHLRIIDVNHHVVGSHDEQHVYVTPPPSSSCTGTRSRMKSNITLPFRNTSLVNGYHILLMIFGSISQCYIHTIAYHWRLSTRASVRRHHHHHHHTAGQYKTSFTYPDKFGVYQYIVKYHRDGYNLVESHSTVPVRPLRHDEHERFVVSAYPYYASVFAVIAGFVVFSTFFALHKPKKTTKTQ